MGRQSIQVQIINQSWPAIKVVIIWDQTQDLASNGIILGSLF